MWAKPHAAGVCGGGGGGEIAASFPLTLALKADWGGTDFHTHQTERKHHTNWSYLLQPQGEPVHPADQEVTEQLPIPHWNVVRGSLWWVRTSTTTQLMKLLLPAL